MRGLILAISLVWISCTTNGRKESPAVESRGQGENFNMAEWRTFRNRPSNSWEVVSGVLHCKSFDEANLRADLITKAQFENFEMSFEWKISFQGNSGIMFRVTEDVSEPYFAGPEFQLLDDINSPGDVPEVQLTGANFHMYAPTQSVAKVVGEWNTGKLVVENAKVQHWLNGVKVVEYEIGSDDWNLRRANSKWADVKTYGLATTGHIALQDHGSEVWFRNIRIKNLQ